MKKRNFKLILILSLVFVCFGMNAQNSLSLWEIASQNDTDNMEKAYRNSSPQEFQLYALNTASLSDALTQAPVRYTRTSNVIIDFPTKNGVLERFRVYEASSFAPALQERHPNIRSYMAQGIDDPSAIARFSLSENDGLHAMISSVNYSTIYIDSYTKDNNYYISYARESLEPDSRSFECLIQERSDIDLSNAPENADDGMLRTFRLALACTGEYAQFHLTNQGVDPGASDAVKKAAVLSAMNTAMTRVNGIYERDIAVHMEIIPNNEDIIYLIAGTDPYTNNSGGTMLGQNQSTIDAVIGDANYDIGHVFSTGGGGIAGLGVVCTSNQKARGVTGLTSPIGDIFYVDFVSHEMGHQFRANHSFNNSCGGNRNNSTAMEPGSGSTIMGYAGICPPNVQNVSDDYFHAISIQEIWNFISVGTGQCAVQTPTGNLPPTADAGADYTIPKSTPFILKGTATDPDGGNVLSHNWEQMNQQIGTMPPQNTSVFGPMFRSNDALSSPDRYMPALTTVLTGATQSLWEVVPSVGRTMNFRYTVRDNVAGGASSASDNMVVTVDGASGPFVVTSQNTATTWQTQGFETITWDVAGTDGAPVNSANVDILFSIDGGLTYPMLIADDIANDGSHDVWVPVVNTTTGRFMIISSDNIFYDLNDGVITVEGSLATTDFDFDNFALWPNPSNGTYNLAFTPAVDERINVSLYDLRGRLISDQTFEDVSSAGLFNTSLDYSSINTGMYFLVVKNGSNVVNKKLIKI
jgi:hypothetical protein